MSKRAQRFAAVAALLAVAFTILAVMAAGNPLIRPTQFTSPLRRLAPAEAGPGTASPEPDATKQPVTEAASGVIVGTDVKHDVSQPLRDIMLPPARPVTSIREMGEPGGTEEEEGRVIQSGPPVEDPVIQRGFGSTPHDPVPLGMPTPLNQQ